MGKKWTVYHGSHEILKSPTFGFANPHNDFGAGFYCTEFLELAKEWACDEVSGGYANKFSLNTSELKILDLNAESYSVIHWLSVVLKNIELTDASDVETTTRQYIIDNYPVNTDCDIILGYRADDIYLSYIRDFLSNKITLNKLKRALELGNLGNQIAIKSELAFSRLKFLGYEEAPQHIHYPLRKKRDELAQTAFVYDRNEQPNYNIFMKDIIIKNITFDKK